MHQNLRRRQSTQSGQVSRVQPARQDHARVGQLSLRGPPDGVPLVQRRTMPLDVDIEHYGGVIYGTVRGTPSGHDTERRQLPGRISEL